MHVSYYITAHGYGHGVRACAVINRIPSDIRVTIHSVLPRRFFDEEINREFDLLAQEFDCGCIQSDSVTVDIPQTLRTYSSISQRNRAHLPKQVEWSKQEHVRVIVGDIPPFAFEVASHAGIPSVAATNFTWFDIYESYLESYPEFEALIEQIGSSYRNASLLLAMAPACTMPYFPIRKDVGVVGRIGVDRRPEFLERLDIAATKRLALIYPGTFGLDDIPWHKLASFDQWHFLGLYDLSGAPANYTRVTKEPAAYQDLTASVDLVVSKLGYSTVAECMVNGTPLLYLPRADFAEYPFLERGVKQWGYGYYLSETSYKSLDWDGVLQKVPARRSVPRIDQSGARACAAEITAIARS